MSVRLLFLSFISVCLLLHSYVCLFVVSFLYLSVCCFILMSVCLLISFLLRFVCCFIHILVCLFFPSYSDGRTEISTKPFLLILWPCGSVKDMLWFMLLKNEHFSFLSNFKQILMRGKQLLMTSDWIGNNRRKNNQGVR